MNEMMRELEILSTGGEKFTSFTESLKISLPFFNRSCLTSQFSRQLLFNLTFPNLTNNKILKFKDDDITALILFLFFFILKSKASRALVLIETLIENTQSACKALPYVTTIAN